MRQCNFFIFATEVTKYRLINVKLIIELDTGKSLMIPCNSIVLGNRLFLFGIQRKQFSVRVYFGNDANKI